MPRRTLRTAATAMATVFLVSLAGPATAHVTVNAPGASAGGFAKLTFRAPTEKPVATTKLEVAFPADQPLAFVSVRPKADWTYEVTRAPLPQPITVEGEQVTEAVTRIVWTATGPGIKTGEFDEFEVSAGPLPAAATMEFKALQTYADGEVRRWIETPVAGQAEPESPSPMLSIAPAVAEGEAAAPAEQAAPATASTAGTAADEGPSGLSIAAFVLSLLALALGAAALARAMKKPARATTTTATS